MKALFISAAHKSSGKTITAVGVCAALRQRGVTTQPLKKGPDYIDPLWLSLAAGRECHNLDFHTMGEDELLTALHGCAEGADLVLVEGNKGLHDGVDTGGRDSNAALAKRLGMPVILVIDSRGITRGIAPLLLGYRHFDPEVHIAGVVLNRVAGPRHETKLRAAIEHYTDLAVLGAVRRSPDLEVAERHLGLVPANEHPGAVGLVRHACAAVRDQIDLTRLLAIADTARVPAAPGSPRATGRASSDLRIAIARDAAFGFYYPGDLAALEAAGCQLVEVDTLRDPALPDVDGMFIGGGFPERHAAALAANRTLRRSIGAAIESGLPVYAECGGLMYLAREIVLEGNRHPMVGAIAADVRVHERPQGRGLVRLRETGIGPWSPLAGGTGVVNAHEFHHGALENCGDLGGFAYEVLRGHGIDGHHDGIVSRNALASFSHLRHVAATPWAERFTAFVRARKRGSMLAVAS